MYLLSRGSGYPVLFIHGIPTSSQLWSGIIDKLLGRFTCMAVDLPGLGRTPKDRCSVTQLQTLADQIEKIRVEHNIDKWHVVGHDAGSAIAVHYAHRFQEHVGRLALLSPAVFPGAEAFSSLPDHPAASPWRVTCTRGERHFLEHRNAIRHGTTTSRGTD
jgi:pimeloyl-ACP methyl ester carboxylesterase